MKILKSLLFAALFLSGALFAQEGPDAKKQRIASSDSEQERKVSAATATASAKPGIQDTLVRYIRHDAAGIVKSYLGYSKQNCDVSEHWEDGDMIHCFAIDEDDQVYIGNKYFLNLLDLKTEKMARIKIGWDEPFSVSLPGGASSTAHIVYDIRQVVPLSSQCSMVQLGAALVLMCTDKKTQQLVITSPLEKLSGSAIAGGINREGKPVLLCTKYEDTVASYAMPTLKSITPITKASNVPVISAFLCNCPAAGRLDGASCVGKSKNGDCIAYQVLKDSIVVFNLETGTPKTTFKVVNPKVLKKADYTTHANANGKDLSCSANNEGCVAVGNYATGCVCVYNEDGTLIKEFTVPTLYSVKLTNKGCCIVVDTQGVLRSYSLKSDEVQEIGTISPCAGGLLKSRMYMYVPMFVAFNHNRPTSLLTINREGVVDKFTDEAEAIEAYDVSAGASRVR